MSYRYANLVPKRDPGNEVVDMLFDLMHLTVICKAWCGIALSQAIDANVP